MVDGGIERMMMGAVQIWRK